MTSFQQIPESRHPDNRLCANCKKRPGTETWGDALAVTHGWAAKWCVMCVLEAQLEHARERAAAIPELERRLAVEALRTERGGRDMLT